MQTPLLFVTWSDHLVPRPFWIKLATWATFSPSWRRNCSGWRCLSRARWRTWRRLERFPIYRPHHIRRRIIDIQHGVEVVSSPTLLLGIAPAALLSFETSIPRHISCLTFPYLTDRAIYQRSFQLLLSSSVILISWGRCCVFFFSGFRRGSLLLVCALGGKGRWGGRVCALSIIMEMEGLFDHGGRRVWVTAFLR